MTSSLRLRKSILKAQEAKKERSRQKREPLIGADHALYQATQDHDYVSCFLSLVDCGVAADQQGRFNAFRDKLRSLADKYNADSDANAVASLVSEGVDNMKEYAAMVRAIPADAIRSKWAPVQDGFNRDGTPYMLDASTLFSEFIGNITGLPCYIGCPDEASVSRVKKSIDLLKTTNYNHSEADLLRTLFYDEPVLSKKTRLDTEIMKVVARYHDNPRFIALLKEVPQSVSTKLAYRLLEGLRTAPDGELLYVENRAPQALLQRCTEFVDSKQADKHGKDLVLAAAKKKQSEATWNTYSVMSKLKQNLGTYPQGEEAYLWALSTRENGGRSNYLEQVAQSSTNDPKASVPALATKIFKKYLGNNGLVMYVDPQGKTAVKNA